MLLLCFIALLSVNGIYATDQNQSISNNSENTTIEIINSTNGSNDETIVNESTSSGNDTENNVDQVMDNETGNSTTNSTTSTDTNSTGQVNNSTSTQSGAAGSATVTDTTFTNVQALFVWSTSLSTIDPSYLASIGITDIYVYVPRTGANLGSFVDKFAGSGIRVWAWIPCFVDSNGNWLIAGESTIDGIDAREWVKQQVSTIVSTYNVTGVLLDYCRYPGTAYKHPSEAEATSIITNFVADVRSLLDTKSAGKGSYIYLGVCVMPECAVNTYYYGQSYEQLSQYVDCLVPMIYKGNYGEDTAWIGSTTSYIVNHSTVPVVAAVQTYESDSNATPINGTELTNDVQTAADNNASGYALFRYGLISSYPDIYGTANFTIEEILEAAQTVKNYIETNKALPPTVTVGNVTMNMAQFLYLATQATVALNNGQPITTNITVGDYTLPSSSSESLTTGTLSLDSYVNFASRIAEYIQDNKQAPPYGIIGLGQISYQSQIYLYSRILTQYKNNGTLPNTITVKQWTNNNIPINEPTTTTVTIAQILTAAQTVKNYIETNKTLPTTITIGTTTLNMAQFLYLTTTATTLLNNGKPTTTTITVGSYTLPNTSTEQLTTGTLNTASYTDLANRIAQYMAGNGQAPPYGIIGLGQISYQSQIYLYSRILTQYKNNGTLPNTITVKQWTNNNIPINEPTTTTVTIAQILTAAQTVKNYIETNKTLPTTITIGTTTLNMAQFLYLTTTATTLLNNGKPTTTTITVGSYTLPNTSTEQLTTGTLNTASYTDLANRIAQYMAGNGQAPPYGIIGLGQISYQSQIYLYSRILTQYKNNGTLPNTITVKQWTNNNIPINEPTTTTVTIAQILTAAQTVKNYIETNKTLPTTITIGTTTLNMAQFLYLTTTATTLLNNGKPTTTTITVGDYTLPNTSTEQLTTGTLNTASYTDLANRIAQYMAGNGQAPPYGIIGLGQISYQSQIYLYSRILTQYKNNGTLPNTITVKQWTNNNIPINEPTTTTVTIAQILTAAQTVKNYIETNKTLPTTITIGTTTLNMAQFLYLTTTATTLLNNGKPTTTTITVGSYTLPSSSSESIVTELLLDDDYLDFAQRIKGYMESNGVAPAYGCVSIGELGYESQIYLYSRILTYYASNGTLPYNVVIKGWAAANMPITGINVQFSIADIAATATGVKNNVDLYKYLPSAANVAGVKITIAQFLYLATQATVQINSKNYNPITLENYNLPSSSSESMSSGSISSSEYVDFASRIVSYMVTNKVAPPCGVVSLGYLGYETQIYLFSQVLDSYANKGVLPSSVSVKPWFTVVYSIPAEYYQYMVATSNCQSDNAQIIALANSITAGASTPYDKSVRIFNWVRDNIGYSFYYDTKYGAVGTLNAGSGNCVDTSHLLIALLRASNIPARYVHGYCQFSSGSWYGHVWTQVYVNGGWYTADATSSYNTFGAINNWNTATATVYGTYASLTF